ncbi:MAG: lipopolysaccharide heptosyltransferase II [Deltaproteobacteria bacterium]|jgi:heptosyltransferase-2|nr:lipopolysaccharide heptosyltransferase II [Deltaproteobacteria bacterium]
MNPSAIDPQSGTYLVRGLNWIGDAVMSLPAINALRTNWPQRHICVVSRHSSAPIYARLSGPSDVIPEIRTFSGRCALVSSLKNRAFAGGLIFTNSLSSTLLLRLGGVPNLCGYLRGIRGLWLKKAFKVDKKVEIYHFCFRFLSLVRLLGLKTPFSLPKIEAIQLPDRFGLPKGFKICLAPGGAYGEAKRWPTPLLAQAAKIILASRSGTAIILGSQSEIKDCLKLEEALRGGPTTINLCGLTSLNEVMSIMSQCALTLANDSGLAHLSAALAVPLVSVFGPTSPLGSTPLGRAGLVETLRAPAPCSPCFKKMCPKPSKICFEPLTGEVAAKAAFKLLDKNIDLGPKAAIWTQEVGRLNWPSQIPKNIKLIALEPTAQTPQPPVGSLIIKSKAVSNQNLASALHELGFSTARTLWISDNHQDLNAFSALGGLTALIVTERTVENLLEIYQSPKLPTLTSPDVGWALDWLADL